MQALAEWNGLAACVQHNPAHEPFACCFGQSI